MIPHIPAAPCHGEKSNTSVEVNTEGASFEFRRLSWVTLCVCVSFEVMCEMRVESSDKVFLSF